MDFSRHPKSGMAGLSPQVRGLAWARAAAGALSLGWVLGGVGAPVWAQPAQGLVATPPAATPAPPPSAQAPGGAVGNPGAVGVVLKGVSETGRAIDLAQWRGKVVMVYAWDTGCGVCLNVMAELRNNLAGWQGQAFELVSVNTDARPDGLQAWHRLRVQTQPTQMHWPSLWAGDPTLTTTLDLKGQLPAVWVLDKAGVVRFQARGRMPAQAWDQVAELL